MSRPTTGRDASAPKSSGAHIYLSSQDVSDLARHNGYTQFNSHHHIAHRYPSWSWEEIHDVLQRSGHLRRPGKQAVPSPYLPEGTIGALISRAGEVLLDDGSLVHEAREQSWSRHDDLRLSEHCVFRGFTASSPVIIHAPHTSLHIPASVRAELLLDDEELRGELEAMTDAGVSGVIDHLSGSPAEVRPAIVAAAMSRLVFDPERFPNGDEMEAVGMGLVYTRRSDGAPLRSELTPERLEWYRAQHRAYTASLERVVDSALDRFGAAVIIDLHSYARDPLGYEDSTRPRPEVCIGTDSFHTPPWLLAATELALAAHFETAVNTPFVGAYVPGRIYRQESRVHSVMIEFRRDMLENSDGLCAATEAIQRAALAAIQHYPPLGARLADGYASSED